MLARVGLRHQYFDVASNEFSGRIAEEPLGRGVDREDRAVPVDRNNGIDCGVDNRAIEGVGQTLVILALKDR
jgi:hypothetical protein